MSLSTTRQVAGAILAGGESRRMGQDKAALVLQRGHINTSLLQHSADLLHASGVDRVFVSGRQEGHSNGLEYVADCSPDMGPLVGMYSILNYIQQQKQYKTLVSGVVFMPVDMPNMRAGGIQTLYQYGYSHQRVSCFQDSFLPLYLPNTPEVMTYLHQVVSGNASRKVGRLIQQLGGSELIAADTSELLNINTPQEWQAFVACDRKNSNNR